MHEYKLNKLIFKKNVVFYCSLHRLMSLMPFFMRKCVSEISLLALLCKEIYCSYKYVKRFNSSRETKSKFGTYIPEVLKYLELINSNSKYKNWNWSSPIPGIDQFLEEFVNSSRIGQFSKNWSNLRKNDCFQLIYVKLRYLIFWYKEYNE